MNVQGPGRDKASKVSSHTKKEEGKGEGVCVVLLYKRDNLNTNSFFHSSSHSDLEENSEEGDEGDSDREEEGGGENWDEDKEWSQIQKSIREERKKKEAGLKRESYPVHSPFFPTVRLFVYSKKQWKLTSIYCPLGET